MKRPARLAVRLLSILAPIVLLAPSAAADSLSGALVISEIMYHPPDWNDISSRDLEFIELHNAGESTLDLGGLRFSAGIDYAFPSGVTLAPDAYLVLTASADAFTAKHGTTPFDVYTGQLSNSGETLVLQAASGETVLRQSYGDGSGWPCGPDGGDFSLVLANVREPALASSWRISTSAGGSPGAADPPPPDDPPQIVVNEVLAHTDPPDQDAVELYNPTPYDQHVGGWFLSDTPDAPRRHQLPEGAYVPAGGYFVVTEAEFGQAETGFALSEGGERIVLTAATCQGELTGYRQERSFGASPNGVSLGRHKTSTGATDFPLQTSVTLGAPNAGPRISPVVISRILYHPSPDGEIQHEYIELRNRTNADAPLHIPALPSITWRVDGVGSYAFPPRTVLAAGARALLVGIDPQQFRALYAVPDDVPIFGPYGGNLDNGGETIALLQPDLPNPSGPQPYIIVDIVDYDDAAPWPPGADGQGSALARIALDAYGNDPANWRADDEPANQIFLPLVKSNADSTD